MIDVQHFGARVLVGLDKGRARINAERRELGRQRLALVRELAAADQAKGLPARGRPARIAKGARISERHARRILDALFSVSESTE